MTSRFKYFAIFGAMRTGSNLLERNLNQFEGINCHGELFNPAFIGKAGQEDYLDVNLSLREADPDRLIRKIVNKSGDDLPGFRIFQGHDPRVFRASLADPNCAKIILRRTPLDSFISLKIARATDQWILGNAPKRKTAVITYDGAEYRDYLARLAEYDADLRRGLQNAGQTAFEIRYEDLKSVEMMNGLAAYLGVPDRRNAFEEKIKRQNPEPVSEKVSNYADMMADVQSLGSDIATGPAPVLNRGLGVRDIVVCRAVPLLFAPLPGVNTTSVQAFMANVDDCAPGQLKTGMNQKALSAWLDEAPDHASFTVVDHPLDRAYSAFMTGIFPPGGAAFPKIRRRLKAHFDVGVPDHLDGWTAAQHGTAFEAFLVFLKSNLAGQTSIRIDGTWEAQHKLLSAMSSVQPIARIIRATEFKDQAPQIAVRLGKTVPPVEDLRSKHHIALGEVYSRRLENLARSAYAKDYRMFGFKDWS